MPIKLLADWKKNVLMEGGFAASVDGWPIRYSLQTSTDVSSPSQG